MNGLVATGGMMTSAVVEYMVSTALGNIRQADLRIVVEQKEENVGVWVWARECFYIGTEFPEAVDTIVRRDVWVTVKSGQEAKAEQPNT
jgi:hypothetical protein